MRESGFQSRSLKSPLSSKSSIGIWIEEALEISNLDPAELDAILAIVLEVDSVIDRETSKRGLIHVDGKKEFALGEGREPILIDSFGTLDEDRWWDADAYEDGEIVQLSKESVRKHYIESGHHSALYEARQSGSPEPPIPLYQIALLPVRPNYTLVCSSGLLERLFDGDT